MVAEGSEEVQPVAQERNQVSQLQRPHRRHSCPNCSLSLQNQGLKPPEGVCSVCIYIATEGVLYVGVYWVCELFVVCCFGTLHS